MTYENTYEQEIDLKDLLFTILYGWRRMLLVAIVLGLLLGGYKVVSGLNSQQDLEEVEKTRQKYELDMKTYERNIASYERDIAYYQNLIDYQESYTDGSILMKIDPYNKPRATADVLFKLDSAEWMEYPQGVNIDPTDSLVKLYASNLVQRVDWSELEEKTGTRDIYLKELVGIGSDYSSNTITIDVTHKDKEMAEEILELVLSQIERCQREFAVIAGSHTVNVVNRNVNTIVDTGLADRQKQNDDKVYSYQNAILDKEKALNGLKEPEVPEELSKKKVALSGIKYAVIGGIGGVFLVAFYFCMMYVLSGKLHSDEELKDQFGLKILGVFALPTKAGALSAIDRWLERMEGRAARLPEEDVLERIIVNIRNYADGAKDLLLTGTISEERLKELSRKLSVRLPGIQLITGADLNQAPDTLRLLAECEAVVLVEERGTSKCRNIQKEKEAIDALKKPVLGCVVI